MIELLKENSRGRDQFGHTGKIKLQTILLTILFLTFLLAGISFYLRSELYKPYKSSLEGKEKSHFLTSNYPNEEIWIITSICSDIAAIINFSVMASTGKKYDVVSDVRVSIGTDDQEYKVQFKVYDEEVIYTLHMKNFIWSPGVYRTWTIFVLNQLRAIPDITTSSINLKMMQDLLSVNTGLFEKHNQLISYKLTQNPLDVYAHEEAALLIAALSLREASGLFFDNRHQLNRLSAHLAIAFALNENGYLSFIGRIADIALRTLSGRQGEAMTMIKSVRKEIDQDSPVATWLKILELRNTGDWRKFNNLDDLSLFEKLEYFRALSFHVGSPGARVKIGDQFFKDNRIPDFSRIALLNTYSVGDGHFFSTVGMAGELKDIKTVLQQRARSNDETDFYRFLNETPIGAVYNGSKGRIEVHVIGDGTWGRYAQRHIFHQATQRYQFLRWKYNSKEAAKVYIEQSKEFLRPLALYPSCWVFRAESQPDYDEAMKNMAELVKNHPEWITASVWKNATKSKDYASLSQNIKLPLPNQWIKPDLPYGTTYHLRSRLSSVRMGKALSFVEYQKNYQLAPWHPYAIVNYAIGKYGKALTSTQLSDIAGPVGDYDQTILLYLADLSEDNVDQYIKVMDKFVQINPDRYFQLGEFLAEQDMEKEAAIAYEKGVMLSHDSITLAANCEWLVDYYYRNNQVKEAIQLAEFALNTGSGSGFITMANLMEKMGRFADAEDYLIQNDNRYDSKKYLLGFYHRMLTDHGLEEYQERFNKGIKDIFPKGLKKVNLSIFQQPPVDGLLYLESNDKLKKNNLKAGTIVVAVDGYRIHNEEQYHTVRMFRDNPEMVLIVWQDDKYSEIETFQKTRLFGIRIQAYRR